jgi:pyruvate formate lyase activating enzyme
LSFEPQTMHGPSGDRVVGQQYTSAELARRLNQQAGVLRASGGGVTFSGGEPLQQAEFLAEVIEQLERTHVLLETSGFAAEADLRLVADQCDMVYFDLKLIDAALHQRYTGVDNGRILANLRVLDSLRRPYVIRVPLVPGVTDTSENLAAIARTAQSLSGRPRIELLPYNRAAGGKYAPCGMQFRPEYDEKQACHPDLTAFQSLGLEAVIIS